MALSQVESRRFGVDASNLRKLLVESAEGGHEGCLVELVKSAGYALARICNDESLSSEEKAGLCIKVPTFWIMHALAYAESM